jgi:CRISPR/Cas system-associated exonuclease Cas4 (RecB family)
MRHLSKSKLIAYRQCPKRLWLEVHNPELKEDSATAEKGFAIGHEVGEIARKIYDRDGTGVLVDIEKDGFNQAFDLTEKLLQSPQPIFEAGLRARGALAFSDVLLPGNGAGDRQWRMVEVKSSTSVKDYHHDDIAVQAYVARTAGVPLTSVSLAHIDSSWVYPGDGNYQGLLHEADLTAEAFSRTAEVKGWIADAQNILLDNVEPNIETGPQCSEPFECSFYEYCSRNKPVPEYPIDWLPRFSSAKVEELALDGITDLSQVPDALLNEKQILVKKHTLANTVFFDAAGAAADLAPYGLPAYFLDFETIQFAVPIWKGTRPYQQIPFQFSLHVLSDADELMHTGFLDLSGDNPSEAFANELVYVCGEQGPVYVYNAAFERSRISELADVFPLLSDKLLAINERVVDLLPIARERFYHPSQQGSWSIKKVLPAIVPALRYDSLEGVQDGGLAMEAFLEAISPEASNERKAEIEKQLVEYCKLDTYAMVLMWKVFSGKHQLRV